MSVYFYTLLSLRFISLCAKCSRSKYKTSAEGSYVKNVQEIFSQLHMLFHKLWVLIVSSNIFVNLDWLS